MRRLTRLLILAVILAPILAVALVIRAGTTDVLSPVDAANRIKQAVNQRLAQQHRPLLTSVACNPDMSDETHFGCNATDTWGSYTTFSAVLSHGAVLTDEGR